MASASLALLLLLRQLSGVEGDGRRLLVGGVEVGSANYPFVARLVLCGGGHGCVEKTKDNTSIGCSCRNFCTGTHIAPGVVLTAAHCFWSSTDRSVVQPSMSPGNAGNIFVLFGVDDLHAANSSSYINIKSVKHAGYHNLAQSTDNDVALAFLNSDGAIGCSGFQKMPLAKVATPDYAGGANKDCHEVLPLGYGLTEPFNVFLNQGRVNPLKADEGVWLHTFENCKAELRRATMNLYTHVPLANFSAEDLAFIGENVTVEYTLSPDRHICFGASSAGGICNGDSGGPVLVKDAWGSYIVVGVNSFGFRNCALFADYGMRVAFYAKWIFDRLEDEIANYAFCGPEGAKPYFASFPVTEWPRSEEDKSRRCFEQDKQWACRAGNGTTKCVPWSKRCDGVEDCEDASDETQSAGCGPISKERCDELLAPTMPIYRERKAADAWFAMVDSLGADLNNISEADHAAVADACHDWHTLAWKAIEFDGFNSSARTLAKDCERQWATNKHGDAVVYSDGKRQSNLKQVMRFAKYCQSQILYSRLYLRHKDTILEEFEQERRTCKEITSRAHVAGRGSLALSWLGLAASLLLGLAGRSW